ncbi:TlpA disulfide reductase family protein [Agriterribacter sp.]|uniref:TlpA disulfide reductase family protein n=1 Tax=Agriterribacter sp. TaxID=2821509 RepID=UPI002B8C40AB|nr:TlpA disulfide reductase family protein [Agriterribacter sp.]HRP58293.1 TlpA disulfide reductase family protein [Agriterribacter sp.]
MKLFFSTFFLLFFLQARSQYKFELNGTVPASLNNKKLILGIWDRYSLHKFEKRDTILIRDNAFSIKGFLNKPSEEAYLLLMDGRSQKYFVLDSGKNNMVVHKIPPSSITKKNKLSEAEMINSNSNVLCKKIGYLYYELYLKKQKNKNSASDSLTRQFWRQLRLKELSLVQQFSDTYYSLILLYQLSGKRASLSLEEIVPAYNGLNDKIRESVLGKELKEKLHNYYTLGPGNGIKSFSAKTPEGLSFTNESLKDTVYLLAFGATWCKPCKDNIPVLKKMYNKFRRKKFTVVYVNLDGHDAVWKSQVADYGLDWINVSDNKKWDESEIVKTFDISAIPQYFIIDQNQRIVYNARHRPDFEPEQMEIIISQLLK